MAPKRRASIKATSNLSNKRRQQSTSEKIIHVSDSRYPPQRSLTDSQREEILEELRQFDLASRYGPCVGITRLERWERAERLGKNPSSRIHGILTDNFLQAELGDDLKLNLWHTVL